MISITIFIIALSCLVSIIAFGNHRLFDKLKFNATFIKEGREYYRFLSYGLIHADYIHLLVNMYVLYIFGSFVESVYIHLFGLKGIYFFILLYAGSLFIATAASYAKHQNNPWYNAVGASGAVSAIVFAYILINPLGGIGLVFIPSLRIPAFVFGILYLIYSAYMAKRGKDNIGHDAHFWGALAGFAFTAALKPALILRFFHLISGSA